MLDSEMTSDSNSSSKPIPNLEITTALKSALKSRGVTYKQVADKLKVSEKTIKRLFKDKDCSLSRLNEICAAINLSIYDLLEFARHYHEPLTELTREQELFLQRHPYHFSFLFFLTMGQKVDDIQDSYALTEVSIFRYLRDLDRQGFLELGANNQFRLLVEGKLLMRLHGPLHDLVKQRNQEFLEYVVDHDGEEFTHFSSSFRYMSPQTFHELTEDLTVIAKKYRKLAYQNEMILPRDKLIPVKWSTLISEYSICGKWPLVELEA
mgnify:CR=1 FL=1